jgi:hypothetical protein
MTYHEWQTQVATLPPESPLAQVLRDWTIERDLLLATIALYRQLMADAATPAAPPESA